jgi:hypothetical protein
MGVCLFRLEQAVFVLPRGFPVRTGVPGQCGRAEIIHSFHAFFL